MTGSKSSKSSSFHSSYQSDDNGIVTNVANFEEIGLDDEARSEPPAAEFVKSSLNPYDASFAADLRTTARQQKRVPMAATNANRPQRELTASPYRSPGMPPRSTTTDGLVLLPMHNGRNSTPVGLGLLPMRSGPKHKGALHNTPSRRVFMNHSTASLPISAARNRSLSPAQPSSQKHNLSVNQLRVRRGSWQSNPNRKSAEELERECDDDDGDDVPDDCFLENIPISPRPPQERTPSMPPSTSTSPDRAPKERVRSVGNGTSPIPAEQGEFRTPKPLVRSATMSDFPVNGITQKGRAKSWTAVLSELSSEAQALTEALEAHAEMEQSKELEMRQRRSFGNSSALDLHKPARVRSAIAELPPLRRTNIMIDPLPVSKEKEAVLSRTRPSWLPPKDPAEEKRHLKQYQKMMALSAESDRKKEAEQRAKSTCKDDTAGTLLRIWEEHVLPNWDSVIQQKRTRELWWRGISARSRGKVWAKAIGNELGLTDASYTAALRRAQGLEKTVKGGSQLTADEEKKKAWLDHIDSDIKKTFPELRIFQPDGPLHDSLKDVLKAYAMYRSDVGYVHGTHTIAALLLLNMDTPASSFQALANILNRPLPLSFQTSDPGAVSRTYSILLSTIEHKSPRLHKLLTESSMAPRQEAYLRDMFLGLFTGCLSLDNSTRLWDVMVFEGDALLVRAGAAYLTALEGKLFGATSAKEICEIVSAGLNDVDEEQWMKAVRSAGKS